MAAPHKPRVAISACLAGEKVRYDGRDKRHDLLLETLGPVVEWVPVCPEVELGMGVPREPIRLVGSPDAPRLLGERSGADHTDAMRRYAGRRIEELVAPGLHGWITKERSPSCGLHGARVWSAREGAPGPAGPGFFLRLLRERLPGLPIADEEQLEDAGARRDFLARCLALRGG
jgi:uncharacterized protein YbbK (DUF523 family)